MISRYRALIALDAYIADYVRQTYGRRNLHTVPVCVDERILQMAPAEPSKRDFVEIVSLGHVTEMRDRTDFLHAVHILRREGVDLRIKIVGRMMTPRTQAIVQRLQLHDAVTCVGEVPQEEAFALLRAADAEAHWLTVPGVGSAGIEAMGLGLPIVTHGYDGIYPGVPLKHGENVVFVDPARPDTIVDGLRLLCTNAERRRIIGQNARALVAKHLTWPTIGERWREIYAEVLR